MIYIKELISSLLVKKINIHNVTDFYYLLEF